MFRVSAMAAIVERMMVGDEGKHEHDGRIGAL
jgi:hypothetical protein